MSPSLKKLTSLTAPVAAVALYTQQNGTTHSKSEDEARSQDKGTQHREQDQDRTSVSSQASKAETPGSKQGSCKSGDAKPVSQNEQDVNETGGGGESRDAARKGEGENIDGSEYLALLREMH